MFNKKQQLVLVFTWPIQTCPFKQLQNMGNHLWRGIKAAAEETCPEKANLFKNLSLSANTVVRRVDITGLVPDWWCCWPAGHSLETPVLVKSTSNRSKQMLYFLNLWQTVKHLNKKICEILTPCFIPRKFLFWSAQNFSPFDHFFLFLVS